MGDEQPPAGWYPDPSVPGGQRYWDGAYWGPTAPPPAVGYPPVPVNTGTNGFAIASLVLGIVWIYWIGSVLAVIFGHIALNQMADPANREGGRGLAIAGLVLGYLWLAVVLAAIVFIAAANA